MENAKRPVDVQENVFAGAVGALLFSLVGGVLWYVLYQVGFLAGISGIVGVVCAIKGYLLFGKAESMKGIIISIIATLVVMVIAWYFCLAGDVYQAYQDWYAAGEVDFTLTFGGAVQAAYLFLQEPEIAGAYFGDLAIGLLLSVVGGGSYVVNAFKRIKTAKDEVSQEMPSETAETAQFSEQEPAKETVTTTEE